ncbi:hypothetical protein [Nocardioides litoris]|uniref:hypothetical protein n=1 Tax=Nocardioides litoris TaxID=1926648 RepID=UPI0011240725|nr:hypothetical protein [Nocardioides litoris]
MIRPPTGDPVDPFDLPDHLGTAAVVWRADDGLDGPLVHGRLVVDGHEDVVCDLLAVDDAYPAPVADDAARSCAHQAWRHGQVHLVSQGDRLTLLVPGSGFSADLVLDVVARLARALGADPASYAVLLRLGR